MNHTKIEKCILLFTADTNILILLYRELKTDGKSFIFAVCRLPFAVNVKLNLSNVSARRTPHAAHWTIPILQYNYLHIDMYM